MRKREFARKRVPKAVFLVICEGETERDYVEMLKVHYRLPIAVRTKISGTKVNQRVVNQYKHDLGLEKGDSCRVFFIYDADVIHIVDKLRQLDGTVILSNPCIELWFMLHVRDYRKAPTSDNIVKELMAADRIWANYQKGRLNDDQSKYLLTNQSQAVGRALQLEWPSCPSSNLHEFIAAMENVKMAETTRKSPFQVLKCPF